MDLTHGVTVQIELVSVVDKAVQNGICQRRIADMFDPIRNGHLGGDDRGRDRLAVFQDLQQIPSLLVSHGSDAKVINDQDLDL
jgi:hypothetical protein